MASCLILSATAARWALAALLWSSSSQAGAESAAPGTLDRAHDAFYNARYDEASAHALQRRTEAPDDLAAYELRTSALLFQLKRLLGDDKRRVQTLDKCAECRDLLAAFQRDTAAAQKLARERLQDHPQDMSTLFLLGKIDLNHVWLYLGPLGRRTGWKEYREAKESLDAVLTADPEHVRAIVARAWIDYIVATRMPWGTKWLFGGGSRPRALVAVRQAASIGGDFYARAEARFALWEMLVREADMGGAAAVARDLARDFPGNRELARFVATHGTPAS